MKLAIKRTVKLDASADDWGLYFVEGRTKVARNLSGAFESIVSRHDKNEARRLMEWEMRGYEEYGAYDSEPRNFLESLLLEVY